LGIEVLTATIFASISASIRLFEKHSFDRWGFLPRVARLEGSERDLVLVGRRLHGQGSSTQALVAAGNNTGVVRCPNWSSTNSQGRGAFRRSALSA
jgi:hypothetical protein